jgi:eukaryotic-like serine/threonine-protein kinase
LTKAWKLNELANKCLDSEEKNYGLLSQQIRLAEVLGHDNLDGLRSQLAKTPRTTSSDHFDAGRALCRQREFSKAMNCFREATRIEPRHFWSWHLLGNCHYELLQWSEALNCYSTCLGLDPDSNVRYFAYQHRAWVYFKQGNYESALTDVEKAKAALDSLPDDIEMSESPKPLLLQARIYSQLRNYHAAEVCLTKALGYRESETEILLERSRIRRPMKNEAGAQADLSEALRRQPSDETGWNQRGLARADNDPQGALADFEEALKLNPTFYIAMQNKASVLSDIGKNDESIEVLNQLIELYPGYVNARIGRAVLLARQGRRDEALVDVHESLSRDRSPATLYQVANVYALTSKQQPSDLDAVMPFLSSALIGGFGLDVIDQDVDMEPARKLSGFQIAIDLVRKMNASLTLEPSRR